MDRFKVRMWSEVEGKYFHGDIAYQCLMQQLAVDTDSWYPIPYDHSKEGVIFEQCIGLKDKNLEWIYEGDKIKLSGSKIYRVVFKDGGFCLEHDIEPDWQDYIPFNGHNNFEILMSNIKKVGTIHDA